ncbi:NAD-dependent epimerase/dehydratase family protein [Microbacterium sp. STN6]|uniref:NAD-dependent epimerase/dehydratase family protein n=1 Tax=Microbacterium sp. STN6 TaxID=2995588 RepID=UPI002260E60F|nr:NAD-dependent epimerase/dehydratase family protein [Microbacterium sp. STN6]MCX7523141.1 NAD-dependent epimerase/dehydratase family protein [Microbacterium sp. STN6]
MRVLLAGATGVIGTRLLPMLLATGHEVVAVSSALAASRGWEPAHPTWRDGFTTL